jgi:glutamine amidotransferase PdxT
VRDGNILAATFHPELTEDLRAHLLFVEMVRSFDRSVATPCIA